MVEKLSKTEDPITDALNSMEDWYRAVIFTPELKVISKKNYEVKENELK